MYKPLIENETKRYYRNLLDETTTIVWRLYKETNSPLYLIIRNQLLDIKENITEKQMSFDEDEIDERYSLGAIATNNFEEGDEIYERLCDILLGAIDYRNYDE